MCYNLGIFNKTLFMKSNFTTTLKYIILVFEIFASSQSVFAQGPKDTRNLPKPPDGCEIGMQVDTLDSCFSDNSILVDIFLSIGCGPYILDYGDGTIITTNNQYNYHNYCDTGTFLVTLMYANYFTKDVPYAYWSVTNNVFTVDFKAFVDSNCFPAAYSFLNLSKCIAPEYDSTGRVLNFVWDYGDGSPLDTTFNGGHMYLDKSNTTYTVKLTGYLNNCSVNSFTTKVNTIPWSNMTKLFFSPSWQSPKSICEFTEDTTMYFPTFCAYEYEWTPSTYLSNPRSYRAKFLGAPGGCDSIKSYTYRLNVSWNGIPLYSDYFEYKVFKKPKNLLSNNPQLQVLCAGQNTTILPYKEVDCISDKTYNWFPNIGLSDNKEKSPTIKLGDSSTYTYQTSYTCNVSVFPCGDTSFIQKFLVLGKEHAPNFYYIYNSNGSVTFSVLNAYEATTHTYTWDFGNGNIKNGNNITLSNLSGNYYVKLSVTNICGGSNTTTNLVTIIPSFNEVNYNKEQCTQNNSKVNYTSFTDFPINADQVWNSGNSVNRTYKGIITIDSAKTLTISGITVQFGMNSKIIVKRGGRLVLQNAVLRGIYKAINPGDTCKGMWQGIEVWGNSAYNHYTNINVHGKVTISGTSQILDAHKAIFVGRRVSCIPSEFEFCSGTRGYIDFVPNYGGGIVDVQGCTFRRNAMDIVFTPYIPTTGNPNTNANRIKNNNFYGGKILDPGYNTNNTVGALPYPNYANRFYASANKFGKTSRQIKTYKIYNLGIYDNKFENAVCGIDAMDSKITVTKTATGAGNSFQNLDCGIHSQYTLSGITYPQVISNNSFNKIKEAAIRMEGGKIITINNNYFGNPSSFSSPIDNPRGIYMYGVSNFNIVDNDFYRLDTAIFILESEVEGGKISSDQKGNIFTQCRQGIMTSGDNQNLQIRCNNNLNNSPSDYINRNWNTAGVLANQGTNADHTSPAGNEFRPSDKKNLYSTTPFYYYAHARAVDNTFATIPTVAAGSIGWDSLHIQNTGYLKQSTSCIPPPPCYPNCNLVLELNRQRRESLLNNYEALFESLDGYGNTLTLLQSLNSMIKTSNELKEELVANSPLSNTVLEALLLNTQKFTEQDLVSAIEHNLPMEESLWDNIKSNLFPILNTNSISLLNTLQNNENNFETLLSIEKKYIDQLNDQQQILEEIVMTEIAEETPEQAEIRLASETNSNKQTAISSYLAKGDFANASTTLASMNIENDADQDWTNFISIPLTLVTNNTTEWNNIDYSQEQTINNYSVSSYSARVMAHSRAIMNLLYGTEYPLMDQNHKWNASRNSPRLLQLQLLKKQSLQNPYPNPATNEVNVPYYSEQKNCCITITDLMGKVIKTFPIEKGYHVLNFTTEDLDTGMYLISLKNVNQKSLFVKKFIVQK